MDGSEFAGKAVIVTGAAQGIGRTIAEQFVQRGAHVVLFDLDADLVVKSARELSPDGTLAVSVGGDVSRRADVQHAVQTCRERFGRLDVMVAHASIADAVPLLEIDDASWQRIMDVNLTGVFLCAQEAGRVMAGSGGGAIV
ncbi:MAG TPA: SDR family NAD(P)-dependent oxidoreductase, partial [Ktedonobacteraceae bacterium]|nr:SDR family NAD(P)-dependent oxidoreductase [Ktedonobacteraceae bacterium]